MLNLLEKILAGFQGCFSRKAAYNWFVIIIIGFIVRHDHAGVTSFIRWLYLDPCHYETMLHFFRASSWSIENLCEKWIAMAIELYPTIKFNGRNLLVGDGIKISKEAQKMPGVKKLHQDSENSGKAETIKGHHVGYVAILVGTAKKAFCLPLRGELHEGVDEIRDEKGVNETPATIVTRMANLVISIAKATGNCCYVALDAYFSTGPAFKIFKAAVDEKGEQIVHLITRAKNNYVGFHDRQLSDKKYHEDDKVKLMDWFDFPEFFETMELTIYNETKVIEFAVLDLLWKPINDFVRFVCVKDGNSRYVLMCSDLNLPAKTIIEIYSYRSKIEVTFLFLKHLLGGFCYRFWTKSLEKLGRKKKADLSQLNEYEFKKVSEVVEAIERYVNLAGIALGLLMYFALNYPSKIWSSYNGWMRTYSSEIPSEAVVQHVIRMEFFSTVWKVPFYGTLKVLQSRMRKRLMLKDHNFEET